MPHLAAGTMPEDEFDRRYVEQAWLAYLHIVPGVVYLFLAPLQLAYRIRSRHYTFHRQLRRVLATAGMISGIFALIFGGLFSFGGVPEASAAVFGQLWLRAFPSPPELSRESPTSSPSQPVTGTASSP